MFEFWAFTKVTSRLSKMGGYLSYLTDVKKEGGGVKAPFGQCSKERHFFLDGFPKLILLNMLHDPVPPMNIKVNQKCQKMCQKV